MRVIQHTNPAAVVATPEESRRDTKLAFGVKMAKHKPTRPPQFDNFVNTESAAPARKLQRRVDAAARSAQYAADRVTDIVADFHRDPRITGAPHVIEWSGGFATHLDYEPHRVEDLAGISDLEIDQLLSVLCD